MFDLHTWVINGNFLALDLLAHNGQHGGFLSAECNRCIDRVLKSSPVSGGLRRGESNASLEV
jgi:hypothetical protein